MESSKNVTPEELEALLTSAEAQIQPTKTQIAKAIGAAVVGLCAALAVNSALVYFAFDVVGLVDLSLREAAAGGLLMTYIVARTK